MLKLIAAITLLAAPVLSAQVKPRPTPPKASTLPRPKEQPPVGWEDHWPLLDHKFELDALHDQSKWDLEGLLADTKMLTDAWVPGFGHAFELDAMKPMPFDHSFELDKWHGLMDEMRLPMKFEMDAFTMSLPDKFGREPGIGAMWDGFPGKDWRVPAGAYPEDPADSLYRQARELLNRGEWRRAVSAFKEIPAKYPNSSYVADALYWQAFALYRIGSGGELREALQLLETQATKYPNARTQSDASALRTRIRGALAARGDASAAEQIARTASDSVKRCDQEDIAVRAEALNALTQSDPDGAAPVLQRVLARRDECSIMLRRNAVFILGSRRRGDAGATSMLIQVAKSDPSPEVRGSAIEWLARNPGDEALATLEELARSSDDERIQRTAVRALVYHPSDRARQLVRGIIERNETPERLRLEALSAFDKERVNADDITWLRGLYAKTDNPRVKQRVLSTLGRVGGPDVDQWFLTMMRNTDEPSEVRITALRRVGKSLAISDLVKLYDSSVERPIREELIGVFAQRPDNEATDKLIDVVKTGTDPNLRRMAIGALSQKKDARTMKFLLELVEK